MGRYRIFDLDIRPVDERPVTWAFTGSPVSGIEHLYSVRDRSQNREYRWEFTVRVPRSREGYIEVRPRGYPNLKVWAGIDRVSINFARANRPPHVGQYYCKTNLADPAGTKTKKVVRARDRHGLPAWFTELNRTIRRKEAVRTSAASDQDHLVVVLPPDEHARMIAAYFAMKVWILKESFVLHV